MANFLRESENSCENLNLAHSDQHRHRFNTHLDFSHYKEPSEVVSNEEHLLHPLDAPHNNFINGDDEPTLPSHTESHEINELSDKHGSDLSGEVSTQEGTTEAGTATEAATEAVSATVTETDEQRREREERESQELAWEIMRQEQQEVYQLQQQFIQQNAEGLSEEDRNIIQQLVNESNQANAMYTASTHVNGVQRTRRNSGNGAAVGEEGDDGDEEEEEDLEEEDSDNWDYERLLELGAAIGDVKTERWHLRCDQVLKSLPTMTFAALQQQQQQQKINSGSVNEGAAANSVNEGAAASSVNEGAAACSVNEGAAASSVNEGAAASSVNEGIAVNASAAAGAWQNASSCLQPGSVFSFPVPGEVEPGSTGSATACFEGQPSTEANADATTPNRFGSELADSSSAYKNSDGGGSGGSSSNKKQCIRAENSEDDALLTTYSDLNASESAVITSAESVTETPATALAATEERCVVCMDGFSTEETVVVLPCCHFFHFDCTKGWLKDHNSCPYCKKQVAASP